MPLPIPVVLAAILPPPISVFVIGLLFLSGVVSISYLFPGK